MITKTTEEKQKKTNRSRMEMDEQGQKDEIKLAIVCVVRIVADTMNYDQS